MLRFDYEPVRKYARLKFKKKMFIFLMVLIVALILLRLSTGTIDYYSWDKYYFYSDLSLTNGININRWYGDLKNVNPLLVRILFNKALLPFIYLMKYLTYAFIALAKIIF